MRNILILKRSSFGDIIHALPTIPPIKRAFPEAKITWLTDIGYGRLLRAIEGVDAVVEIGFRSLARRKRLTSYFGKLKELRQVRFDALLDLQGTLKSWFLLARARAARKIGFDRADLREPMVRFFYTEQAPPLQESLHVIRKNLRLLETLGVEAEKIEFPRVSIDPAKSTGVDRWLERQGLSGGVGFVAVNPFAAWRNKLWPQEHAAALCRMVRRELNMGTVILHGPHEGGAAGEIARMSDGAAVPAPPTDILQLAALLSRACSGRPTRSATARSTPRTRSSESSWVARIALAIGVKRAAASGQNACEG